MPPSRRVRYGFGIAIGVAVVVLAIPSQQGIPIVETNSPGIISGSGTSTNPLDVKLTTDGVTMTGNGTPSSPLSSTALSGLQFSLFGDGSDGSSAPCGVIAANTTLTRTIFCTDLTINSGVVLNPGGWRIFVTGTLTLNGKISASGGDASGTSGGAAGGNGYNGELCPGGGGGGANAGGGPANSAFCAHAGFPIQPDECSNSGGAGATATLSATAGGRCKGGGGGRGRSNGSGNGPSAGQVNPTNIIAGSWRAPFTAYYMLPGARFGNQAQPFTQAFTGGTGGGGGGTGDFCCCTAGAGGGGGGVIMIAAREIVGTGSIESKGGNGSSVANGGGGGGGGGGGVISIFIGTGSFPTTNVAGGTGAGNGTGCFGQASPGADGGAGLVTLHKAGV